MKWCSTCKLAGLTVLFFIVQSASVLAVNLTVNPVKLYFNKDNKTNILKVKNNSDKETTLQLSAHSWDHDIQGNNIYNPTKEIVFFPRIVKLGEGEEKIVRIGTQLPQGKEEKTFRLFLEEIERRGSTNSTAVKMLMKVGIPLFVEPLESRRKGRIDKVELEGGKLSLHVLNEGNVHFIMRSILVTGRNDRGQEVYKNEFGGWYEHAGKVKILTSEIPREKCLQVKKLNVEIETERFTMDRDLEISDEMCSL